MKNFFKIFLFFLMLLSFMGCASLKDIPKKIWGSSTKALEDARKYGRRETFNFDYETSFNKIIEILKNMDCYIHIKDKKRHMIVAFRFQGVNDTTELGIFFTPLDSEHLTGFIEKGPDSTEIELSSTSSSLLDYASDKIFSAMSKINMEGDSK